MKPVTLPPTLHESDPDVGRERFDVLQAAAYLQISRAALYREVAAGRIGHRRSGTGKRGGTIRFSQRDLDVWRLAQHRAPTNRESKEVLDVLRDVPRSDVRPGGSLAPFMPKVRRFAS